VWHWRVQHDKRYALSWACDGKAHHGCQGLVLLRADAAYFSAVQSGGVGWAGKWGGRGQDCAAEECCLPRPGRCMRWPGGLSSGGLR